jgi:hypothetical protein
VRSSAKACGCSIKVIDDQMPVQGLGDTSRKVHEMQSIEYCPSHQAAPELLKALKDIYALALEIHGTGEVSVRHKFVLDHAEHAIAKAEGKK